MTIKAHTTKIRQALTTGTYDIDTALQACDDLDKLAALELSKQDASLALTTGIIPAAPPATKPYAKDEALMEDDGPPKKPTAAE